MFRECLFVDFFKEYFASDLTCSCFFGIYHVLFADFLIIDGIEHVAIIECTGIDTQIRETCQWHKQRR
jgi:hypothetical protein